MDRRELLALCGLAGLGGCLGYDVVERETVADRRVRLAELEATVEAREERIAALEREVARLRRRLAGPRINAVSVVERWERIGDVVVRGTDEVSAGDPLAVAVSFTYPIRSSGRVDVSLTVELTDADGRRVARNAREVRFVLDPDATLGELPVRFGEPGLSPGRYAATARVVDRVTGLETASDAVAFRAR
ncbi:hypothetical protein C2R22_18905 [Salinigranum rubrum]|uniref:Uncharacterized protein n=1 Tax=Salinigranum rubrum TaxID=755307 RepID=A0A2I8VNF3_9EURY|nr:hypothetical protein [Salinigranum rubrum]AUV83456.1 hypothetical protein C2R22_18905 [Salinigranum rubrum]